VIIRIAISELRTMGRATQGVRLITLKGNEEIASVAKIEHDEEEDKELDENAENPGTTDIAPDDKDDVIE
jgi:DNA gyrase subunit A